ncbi:toxin-antitoxin system HicB family antitoxin [Anaerovibrio lipolyticus]|uniref:type II toxin-antitoxin system HicB family antitoxin n=1 Tax=Anaerovibrio lipolyticus TaxID=82374 RepID=UPI0026F1532F|nr:toxin-antitoxin system HicB family antitoxin [Anaerovibrio lipolyticus]MBE6105218.1 toxin-antitoxin system HicB family antitoxin [Anaerovibrio lipolyticus]
MEKTLEYYMELDYPVELSKIKPEEGGGFFVSVPLLPGCMSDGDTLEEAYSNIVEAKKEWFSSMIERKMEIPEPAEKEEYSGKFMVRLPKSLHKTLVQLSKREGVSLNQYVTNSLAYTAGQRI